MDDRRRTFLRQAGLLSLGACLGAGSMGCTPSRPTTAESLLVAGNAVTEQERWQRLQALAADVQLEPAMQESLRALLPYVERWARGREIAQTEWTDREEKRYLPWPVRGGGIDDDVPPAPPEDSPLYPLWCWYRSRLLIWQAIEYGEIRGNAEALARHYADADKLLQIAQRAYPENPIIGLYLGQQQAWPVDHRPQPAAPDWAIDQTVALSGLRDVIHWWIDNRQLTDGQYGGGWGDDVEMWRWWTPCLIGLQDDKIQQAQRRLSQGLFGLQKMQGGYTDQMDDVEHTAEDSADTITAMMHIDPADEVWTARARQLVKLMKERWTGTNERGLLQFKSTYFTHADVDLSPRKACDTVYHPRAVQPALLLWQRSRDPELTEIFTTWLRTWVDAAARAERGKPAGIIPSAIHWPDGRVGGVGPDWWKPGNYTDNPLYVWPSAMGMMTNSLLLAFHITGDRSFLDPITSMAEIRLHYFRKGVVRPEVEGSLDWCASKMGGFLTPTLAKYRLLTGDTRFDELLAMEDDPYVQFSFFGKTEPYERGMQDNARALSHNFPVYTSEVRWTDRILNFNSHYLREMDPETAVANPRLLYSALTGDPGDPLYFPLNGFQWLTDRTDLAVRVKTQSTKGAVIELFGFFPERRTVRLRSYLLAPGQYQLTLSAQDGEALSGQTLTLDLPINELAVAVPGNRELVMEIKLV